jgi:hypothetical protein
LLIYLLAIPTDRQKINAGGLVMEMQAEGIESFLQLLAWGLNQHSLVDAELDLVATALAGFYGALDGTWR